MKLQRNELIVIVLIIVYIAFFTHPPPSHISNLLESPVGHMVMLLGILYVITYQSLIVGIFLGIAYIMTSSNIIEHLTTFASYAETPEIVDRGVARFGQDSRSLSKINDERLSRGEKALTLTELKKYKADQISASKDKATKNKLPTSNGVPKATTTGIVSSATSGTTSSTSATSGSTAKNATIDLSELKGMDLSKRLVVKPASTSKESFGNFAAF